jgi:hypothetical protein
VFSAIFYSPYIFTKRIAAIQEDTEPGLNITSCKYDVVNNEVGDSDVGKILIIGTSVIRGFICTALVVIINIISKIKLSAALDKKAEMKGLKKKIQASNKYGFDFCRSWIIRIYLNLKLWYSDNDFRMNNFNNNFSIVLIHFHGIHPDIYTRENPGIRFSCST